MLDLLPRGLHTFLFNGPLCMLLPAFPTVVLLLLCGRLLPINHEPWNQGYKLILKKEQTVTLQPSVWHIFQKLTRNSPPTD